MQKTIKAGLKPRQVIDPFSKEGLRILTEQDIEGLRKNKQYTVKLKCPHEQQAKFIYSKAKRKIVRAGRRGGKTTGIAIMAVEKFCQGKRILYAVPSSDQLMRFWKEVCAALQEPIQAGAYYKNETEHIIELLGTEQRIKAKTAWNADMLRGDYADELILDEWQLMNEETWTTIGAPMLMDHHGNATFIYTPPSMHSKSVTKANDPRHAPKMFAEAEKRIAADIAAGREPLWATFHFTSMDNPNLSRQGLAQVTEDMTQLAIRQEIFAEDLEEVAGAMWTREMLDENRFDIPPNDLAVIGVGVDPPGGATECGIVTAGTAMCGCKGILELHGFVIEDRSLKASPDKWAKAVHTAYWGNKADCVYGEKNYGGDMVENTIKTVDVPNADRIRYKNVSASRGKAVRAQPVVALYEQSKVHHVGAFPELEDEMCSWVPGISSWSPNRLDALVWVLTELLVGLGVGHLSELEQPPVSPGQLFDQREGTLDRYTGGAGKPVFSGFRNKVL